MVGRCCGRRRGNPTRSGAVLPSDVRPTGGADAQAGRRSPHPRRALPAAKGFDTHSVALTALSCRGGRGQEPSKRRGGVAARGEGVRARGRGARGDPARARGRGRRVRRAPRGAAPGACMAAAGRPFALVQRPLSSSVGVRDRYASRRSPERMALSRGLAARGTLVLFLERRAAGQPLPMVCVTFLEEVIAVERTGALPAFGPPPAVRFRGDEHVFPNAARYSCSKRRGCPLFGLGPTASGGWQEEQASDCRSGAPGHEERLSMVPPWLGLAVRLGPDLVWPSLSRFKIRARGRRGT